MQKAFGKKSDEVKTTSERKKEHYVLVPMTKAMKNVWFLRRKERREKHKRRFESRNTSEKR